MTFGESVRTCFSKYVDFNGVASRSEFWWFILFLVIVGVVLNFVDRMMGTAVLGAIFSLATILPQLAVPTVASSEPAVPEPGDQVEVPEPVEMEEPDIETDVTTVELADLPANDSLELGRLTGLRPELALMTASRTSTRRSRARPRGRALRERHRACRP